MSRDDQHRTRAERNEQFAESLDKTDPIRENWAVVAAFYSALHYVEQFLSKHGTPCENHEARNEQFKGDARIQRAYSSYHYLYSLSRKARYQCETLPDKAFEKLAKPQLAAVKKQIDHALGLAAQVQPKHGTEKVAAQKFMAEPEKPKPGRPPQ
jgi:hypothetical protein